MRLSSISSLLGRYAVPGLFAVLVALVIYVMSGPANTANTPDTKVVMDTPNTACPEAGEPAPPTGMEPAPLRLPKPGCDLCTEENPVARVGADGLANFRPRLCNRGSVPRTLHLAVRDFTAVGWNGEPYELNTTRALGAEIDADKPFVEGRKPLAAGQCVGLQIAVGNLWQAGSMRSVLRDRDSEIAGLEARRSSVPFALKIDGPNPGKLDLTLFKGKAAKFQIHNDDAMTYRFRWILELGDETRSGCALVAPHHKVALTVALDNGAFGLLESGLLRPGSRSGRLLLRHEPDPEYLNLPATPKDIPVAARLNYFANRDVQHIANFSVVFLALSLGVVGSLVINFALPMQRKRVALKQRLAELDALLNGQGSVAGTRVVNILRVELGRLRAAVNDHWPIVPEIETVLPQLDAKVNGLERRVALARAAGSTQVEARSSTTLALHEIEAIVDNCAAALRIVELPAPGEADLQRAQDLINRATTVAATALIPPDAKAVQELDARAKGAKLPLAVLAPPPGALPAALPPADTELWKDLDDLLLDLQQGYAGMSSTPTRAEYVLASRAIWKAEAILTFQKLIQNSGSATVYRSRLDRARELLDALLPGAKESIPGAARLMREIEQNVSRSDLLAALTPKAPTLAWIEVSPPNPAQFQTTRLRVRLSDPGLDESDARRSLRCVWRVDDTELEGDFLAYHFFERKLSYRPSTFRIDAELFDGLHSLRKLPQATVSLPRSGDLVRSSTWLAIFSLLITVFVVTVGLLTAAQEKLQPLGWASGLVALFVLGYGADVVKRALAR